MTKIVTLTNGNEVEAGTWFDGTHGWHNTYRIIDTAEYHGFKMDADDKAAVEQYRNSGDCAGDSDDELDMMEAVSGQGGLSSKATEYMQELLPQGWVLRWDDGLTLLPDWMDCAADGDGCQVDVDTDGNEVLVKRCYDHEREA